MLEFRKQKTTTIRFPITEYKTKTPHTSSLTYKLYTTRFHTNSLIIEKTSNRIIIKGKKSLKNKTKALRNLH